MIRYIATTLPLLLGIGVACADNTAAYSNHRGTDTFTWWGANKAESYDVAVKIEAPEFVGLDICGITFHVAEAEGISDYKIWASNTLSLENKVNVPDIFSYDITPSDGTISLKFETPCHIGEEGLYLGYSFSVDTADEDSQKKPVAVIKDSPDGCYNFYIHTSKTYGKWIDNGEKAKYLVPFELTLSGLDGENVTIALPKNLYGASGKEIPVSATLTNYGYEEVTTATLLYEAGSRNGEIEVACSGLPASEFLMKSSVSFNLPAIDTLSEGALRISVKEVNGKPNSASGITDETKFEVFSYLPQRRPLLEEYTGTGCGWCPRGAIGLEKMREMYGDRFIGVAYHCDDIMSIFPEEERPNLAPAQPVAWIDRVRETDPYFGDSSTEGESFGIDRVWSLIADSFTPVSLGVNCDWTDDTKTALSVKSEAEFVKGFTESDFRMIYLLVENGLSGETPQWFQSNYYSGETGRFPEAFDFLVELPKTISGYVYNDVVIYSTDPKGIGGSLPTEIDADSRYPHSITLNLSDAVNLDGENLVQDREKISVVAAIIDANTGEILNCAEAMPGNSSVESVYEDEEGEAVYYTLEGIKITAPKKGAVLIKRVTRKDGSVFTRKVLIR